MRKFPVTVFCLLLTTGFCFAKQNAQLAGPFQLGNVLTPLATLSMKTAEIAAFMPGKNMLFVVGGEKMVEVVDLSNPGLPKKVAEVQVPGNASSVTVHGDLVAVSLLDDEEWRDGQVQVMRYTDSLEVVYNFAVHIGGENDNNTRVLNVCRDGYIYLYDIDKDGNHVHADDEKIYKFNNEDILNAVREIYGAEVNAEQE